MTEASTRPRELNFAIRYLTKYAYDADVVDNLNALRVRPAVNARQRVDEFTIRLSPDARLTRHNDYFGTEVVEFEITRPHHELTIDVRARVATSQQPAPEPSSWEALRSHEYREAGGEFLLQTDDAAGHPMLEELIAATAVAGDPLSAVLLLCDLIPDQFEYRQGATYVDSRLTDVLDGGAGVCQDFVHLALCVLRHHGIAARYVSGYLFTTGSDEEGNDVDALLDSRESVEVETHAWIEALLAVKDGEPHWVSTDPTNRGLASERHVKIGHGRYYVDVPPIRGVYRGVANAKLDASVTMTRVDGTDPSAIARA
jgi:transglutaminase-like putative cysteine protease